MKDNCNFMQVELFELRFENFPFLFKGSQFTFKAVNSEALEFLKASKYSFLQLSQSPSVLAAKPSIHRIISREIPKVS